MPTPQGIEIVIDGGRTQGFGHAGRCLALWEALQTPAVFRTNDTLVSQYLAERGASVADEDPRVVVLDRFAPTDREEVRRLRAEGRAVCLIDDFGDGRADAELVVDPPTAASWPPAPGTRLAGFEHVLVRRDVIGARGIPRTDAVLVAIGGSDPLGLTPAVTSAIDSAGLNVRYALGPGYAGATPEAGVRIAPSSWERELAAATLYVGAYGQSLLEAAALGTPAVAIVYRPDQLEHARAFGGNGTTEVRDMTVDRNVSALAELIVALYSDDKKRAEMSERGLTLIDGGGAARVAQAVEALL